MKLPAMLNAVQTTPPIISEATMPPAPFSPTATMMTLAKMSVISVMPDTGLLPTMAMALAATVVKRKAMTATSRIPTTAKSRLPCMMPVKKKIKVANNTAMVPIAMILKLISCCVRSTCCVAFAPPLSSRPANPTASRMMFQLRMMPIMPAIAIPPMPMLRA